MILQAYVDAILNELYQTRAITVTDTDVVYRLLLWYSTIYRPMAEGENAVDFVLHVLAQYRRANVRTRCHISESEMDALEKHLHEEARLPAGSTPRSLL